MRAGSTAPQVQQGPWQPGYPPAGLSVPCEGVAAVPALRRRGRNDESTVDKLAKNRPKCGAAFSSPLGEIGDRELDVRIEVAEDFPSGAGRDLMPAKISQGIGPVSMADEQTFRDEIR